MKQGILNFGSSVVVTFLLAGPTLAQSWRGRGWWGDRDPGPTPVAVPEIDASTGLLALAAVFAATLFIWERRRRRA
ncbi:VPEID-CTERM sorting domain-containing protein [Salinihabitans flavidus]|uniref:VPEID-CTERM sorting domain-containing protein n=1 Tax=Salinihabitans flavidus TaxID=569882 RepID=UPI001FDEE093|nr:VPEID-CTERM sorting domain-containing protein [Salinihabitans flavidus]